MAIINCMTHMMYDQMYYMTHMMYDQTQLLDSTVHVRKARTPCIIDPFSMAVILLCPHDVRSVAGGIKPHHLMPLWSD